ncbi:hypothetical protein [Kitasatospora sp. NPDC088346]|uniref:LppU/SCO3897 family protein n=1 Tax=Kitasatospora sp. NPDC088346 TaxID=3364073 RepID=UPI0037F22073
MRFLSLHGPFCRTCGIAAHRDMTAKSLWQGWWGIGSMLVNPLTLLVNLPQRAKIDRLPEPVPGAPGRPLDPGKPLYRRAAIAGLVVPALLLPVIVAGIVWVVQRDPEFGSAGDCLNNGGSDRFPRMTVVPCSGSDAEYRLIAKFDDSDDMARCDPYTDSTAAFVEVRGSTRYVLCLKALSG